MNEKEMKKAVKLNEEMFLERIDELSRENKHKGFLLKEETKLRKKTFSTLNKAMKDLSKGIKKRDRQILFLNELLDKRELEIKGLKDCVLSGESEEWNLPGKKYFCMLWF